MVLDHGISRTSATPRPWAFGENGVPRELEGFILSRQVEGCTEETLRSYTHRIGQFFRFTATTNGFDGIDRGHVDRYLLHLQQLGRSPHYVHSNFRALRTFFKWCQAEEFIEHSPMRNMKPPRLPRIGKPFLSETQRDQLLRLCPIVTFIGARNAALIWLFWGSGIRLSENARLSKSDLDWANNRIRVFGKGQKERYAPFTKKAKKAVWRYLSYRRDDLPQLWLTEERRPATKSMIISAMRRLIDRAGLRGAIKDQDHIFRRTWVWRNLKAGVSLQYIKLAGGWTTLAMLMKYVEAMESEEAMGANWQE